MIEPILLLQCFQGWSDAETRRYYGYVAIGNAFFIGNVNRSIFTGWVVVATVSLFNGRWFIVR